VGCLNRVDEYTRAREPWTDFGDVPAALNQPFNAFPHDYATLPALSFVIPNLRDSMHSGSVSRGDHWLAANIAAYATWARTNHSWLVITWDEDDRSAANHIPTLITGAGIVAGTYRQPIDHYDLLRTIEVALGLPAIGGAAHAPVISGVIPH
jgi:acid phosphatase